MTKQPSPHPASLEAIADRLSRLREAKGFASQADLCRQLDIGQTQWNNYERAVARIRVDEAIKLVQRLGVSLDWIYLGDERWMPNDLLGKIKSVRAIA